MKALGLYPGEPDEIMWLGDECAGTIVALGEGVEKLQIGEEVIATGPACFGSFATTRADFVAPKPAHLSFEEAATVPVAFLTAYYALYHLGKLGKGERVLIHAAAGGVGLAAIQLARFAGAEIFATAGNPEKREFLHSLGIEHVMDSRSLAFAEEVMERTNGEGVDVVLNSLAGEAIPKSLSVLRGNGRFLEIGKRDIYQNSHLGLGHLRNNIAFFAIDLATMFARRPDFCGTMLREVMKQLENTTLKPPSIPCLSHLGSRGRLSSHGASEAHRQDRCVSGGAAGDGSRCLRSGSEVPLRRYFPNYRRTRRVWSRDRSVDDRAGGAPSRPDGKRRYELARGSGMPWERCRALGPRWWWRPVTSRIRTTSRVYWRTSTSPCLPLRGVIHAAMVLDDVSVLEMDMDRLKTAMAPKMSGAWNLHSMTTSSKLDFFVLFSSAASLIGSPGQGNYVAGNAFLEGLAHYRRAQSQPAMTIQWGRLTEVGYVARHAEVGERLERVGTEGILAETGGDDTWTTDTTKPDPDGSGAHRLEAVAQVSLGDERLALPFHRRGSVRCVRGWRSRNTRHTPIRGTRQTSTVGRVLYSTRVGPRIAARPFASRYAEAFARAGTRLPHGR